MAEQKVLTLLGFAKKAGKLVAGDSNVQAALDKKQGRLLIVATDISEKNKERWYKRAKMHAINVLEISTKPVLGLAVGLSPRGILCILDERMAQAIEDAMDK